MAADPRRISQRPLGETDGHALPSRWSRLGQLFDELIIGPQIPELIERKYLVKTIYYAPADPDLKGVETRQGDYVIKQLANRMNRDGKLQRARSAHFTGSFCLVCKLGAKSL